jgi:6-phosphofructokinase 1
MGRHAGWIAAAGGLAGEKPGDAPHIILFPELAFDQPAFLARVKQSVERYGYCVVVASEGVRDADGKFLAEAGSRDAFGHAQLGGVAPYLAALVKRELDYKYHWALADYLQRAARHIASKTDVEQAYATGKAAVEFALKGYNAVMPTIVRKSDKPYKWSIGMAKLVDVANHEKFMPDDFIREDGFHITEKCRTYLSPLIAGEAYPPYRNGLPQYVQLKNLAVKKKLKKSFKI